jgi:hypothetical protein
LGARSVSDSTAIEGLSTISIFARKAGRRPVGGFGNLRHSARFQVAAEALHDRREATEGVELIDDDRERQHVVEEDRAVAGRRHHVAVHVAENHARDLDRPRENERRRHQPKPIRLWSETQKGLPIVQSLRQKRRSNPSIECANLLRD